MGARADAKRCLGLCGPDKASLRFGVRLGLQGSADRSGSASRRCRASTERGAEIGLHDQVARKGPWRTVYLRRAWAVMTNSVDVRAHIVDVFRRDLIGPGAAGCRSRQRAAERKPVALVSGRISRARGGSARPRRGRRRERSVRPGRDGNRRRGAGRRWRRRRRDRQRGAGGAQRAPAVSAVVGRSDGAARSGCHVDRSARFLGRLSNRTAVA